MHMRFIRWFSGSHRLAFGLFAAAIAGLFMGGLLLPTVQFVDETATRFPGGLAGVLEYTNQLTVGDLDGDGDLDLVFANGGGFSTASAPLKLRVWINTGVNSGVFADETDARTGGLTFIARGCELGDVERDGDLDIIIAQDFNRQPTLLINNGSGVFANETATRLPVGTFSSTRAQFGDVDNDGDLDIYINNAGATNRFGSGRGKLWLNNGSGVFADVTATNTVNETVGQPMDAIFGDIDGDFDLDVHVGSRSGTSKLYRTTARESSPRRRSPAARRPIPTTSATWTAMAISTSSAPTPVRGIRNCRCSTMELGRTAPARSPDRASMTTTPSSSTSMTTATTTSSSPPSAGRSVST